MCFIFARRKVNSNEINNINIFNLENFHTEEADEYFLPYIADPGRKHIFTISIIHLLEEKEIRRCSTKERTCYASTARKTAHVEKVKFKKNIKNIEANTPSGKVINEQKMNKYIRYIIRHSPALFNSYNQKFPVVRFHNY